MGNIREYCSLWSRTSISTFLFVTSFSAFLADQHHDLLIIKLQQSFAYIFNSFFKYFQQIFPLVDGSRLVIFAITRLWQFARNQSLGRADPVFHQKI